MKMKTNINILGGLFLTIIIVGIFSCKYYTNNNFRQNYANANEFLHSPESKIPFFKIHFKNGDISLLENWSLTSNQDSITGLGTLYDFNRNEIQKGALAFSIDDIAIIETNELEHITTKDKGRIAGLVILTGLGLVLDIVCLSNPKACFGSCPTFYLEGDVDLHDVCAEGFSSSIAPSLEKRDIDALNHQTSAADFSLTMKNEAYETHLVNELLIHAVPKKKSERIFHDRNGEYYNCESLIRCKQAVVYSREILDFVNHIDNKEYFSTTDSFDLSTRESLVFEFEKCTKKEHGIVLNFRQTLLTTFLLYSGLSYMGDEVGDFFAKVETSEKIKKRLGDPFRRLGGIKIFAWNEDNGKWVFMDELYETGPISKNLIITPIGTQYPVNGKMKIKLEMAKGLWRLDYIGVAPIIAKVNPQIAQPIGVDIIDGHDFNIDKIKFDDQNYLVSLPGNEFKFNFKLPAISDGHDFELFLSSKGYYLEWIREEWLEGKNLPKLRKMLMNDRKTWRELAKEFKTMEHEMETVFWNSKYVKLQ